jgi:HPt (histidine-containing phosphotransfer) domain-containing protein
MDKNIFDINKLLRDIYFKLQDNCTHNNIELIFNMSKNVPKELKGDYKTIEIVLLKVLSKIFQECQDVEVVMVIEAKDDFVYEETVLFKITHIPINNQLLLEEIENSITKELVSLDGTFTFSCNGTIEIGIPLVIVNLGCRRYYRLPSKSLLHKNILLIIYSQNVTFSITKMFKYFPYNVDISLKKFREDKYNLADYDLVVIEDHLIENRFLELIESVQSNKNLKLVIFKNQNSSYKVNVASGYLYKPVTQESVFELIVSMFTHGDINIGGLEHESDIDSSISKDEFEMILNKKKSHYQQVLDSVSGLQRARRTDKAYCDILEEFLEKFEKSDLYFKELISSKSYDEIEEFCKDLKRSTNLIGAKSMYQFAETLELVFEYKRFDYLPIYPGRYHLELEKLLKEIREYLYI